MVHRLDIGAATRVTDAQDSKTSHERSPSDGPSRTALALGGCSAAASDMSHLQCWMQRTSEMLSCQTWRRRVLPSPANTLSYGARQLAIRGITSPQTGGVAMMTTLT